MALSHVILKYLPTKDLKLGVVLEDYKRAINNIIDEVNASGGGGNAANVFAALDPNYFVQGDKIFIKCSIDAGTGLTGGGTLGANRTISLSHLGLESLTDPGADRILFWDESENASKWLTVSTGLQITTTSLTTKDSEIDHDQLLNFASNEHFLQTDIAYVSTALATGLLKVTTGTGALSVVTDNSTNWDTAYGWGNHAGLYDTAGTAAGLVGAHESTYNHANYNTAYGWGNHAGLYDVTGTASGLMGTHESTYNHTNYNTAYGWGNHALAGYLTSVTAHALLSATHTNTTTGTVVRGDVITGQGTGTPTWAKLAIGTSGKFLGSDGTDVSWITPDHDALTNFVAAKHYDWTNETHNIVTTGTISIGTNPATGGRIRIPNNSVISARNAADSANLNMIYADTGNRVIVGSLNSIICHPSGNMGVGSTATDIEAMSVYGRLALVETTAPSGTASYGKLYVKTSDHKLYYMNASGVEYYVAG
jgi:hypothetical protein